MEEMANRASLHSGDPNFGDFFGAILSSSDLAVYVIRVTADQQFTFLDANDVVVRIAGRPIEDIVGKSPLECLPADVGECLTDRLCECAESGASVSYDRTLDRSQGRLSFRTTLTPVAHKPDGHRYIVGITRDVTMESDLADGAARNAAFMRTLGITLPSAIYLLDVQAETIRFIGGDAANKQRSTWRKGAEEAGPMAAARFFHPDDHEKAAAHLRRLTELPDGEVSTISYRILRPDGQYYRHANRETVFSRDAEGRVEMILGISEDVSEQDRVREEVRDLSARMLTLQVEERRLIAQELHDSTGQHLTAAGLALGNARTVRTLETEEEQRQLATALDEAGHSLQEAQREIRVLSYLLHPPEISSQGLGKALESFATGFGRRAGLQVELSIAPNAAVVGDDIALQLFRVCQEALTNVFRHANATRVFVLLTIDEALATLTVRDNGRGFGDAVSKNILGVGLPGMTERMERLGGELKVNGDRSGTILAAAVPLAKVEGF